MMSPVTPTNRSVATWPCKRDDTLWVGRCEALTRVKAETVYITNNGMGTGVIPSSETFRCQLDADHDSPHHYSEGPVTGISGPWAIEWETTA